jgi:hypothetical protein
MDSGRKSLSARATGFAGADASAAGDIADEERARDRAALNRYSVYWLYWYKSTIIDTATAPRSTELASRRSCLECSLMYATQTYASRMLTYAHVCSRMLTYALNSAQQRCRQGGVV